MSYSGIGVAGRTRTRTRMTSRGRRASRTTEFGDGASDRDVVYIF